LVVVKVRRYWRYAVVAVVVLALSPALRTWHGWLRVTVSVLVALMIILLLEIVTHRSRRRRGADRATD
jgi:hypothetical protein